MKQCNWCESEGVFTCVCGKHYCHDHGEAVPPKCCDCFDLEVFGDTYRFRLLDGTIVEDVSVIPEHEVIRLVSAYTAKVRELETLIRSAGRHKARLRAKLDANGVAGPKVSVVQPTDKAKKAEKKPDLAELAQALMGMDQETLNKLLKGVKNA